MAQDHEEARAERPYEGAAGHTRVEQQHVMLPGGTARVVSVHRAVNVSANPELREAALSGALHRFETGERLAVPFVFHDPEAQELVLVLPEELRHRALVELAELHAAIAEDRSHPVPSYAQRPNVVVGVEALRAHLERSGSTAGLEARGSDLDQREQLQAQAQTKLRARSEALDERERNLTTREDRLQERGEELTTREDDLRLALERLEAEQRAIELREAELARRLEQVMARESDSAERPVEVTRDDVVLLSDTEDLAQSLEPDTGELDNPDAGTLAPDADDVASVQDAEVDELTPFDDPDGASVVGEEDDLEELENIEELSDLSDIEVLDDAHELEDLEDLEDLEELEDVEELVDADELEDVRTSVAELEGDEGGPIESVIPAPVTPPDDFLSQRDQQLAIRRIEDETWVFVRLTEGHEEAFREATDLLAQYVVVDGYPVVLLALLDEGTDGGRPYVRRCAVDPASEHGDAVLAALSEEFAVHVAVFGPNDHFERVLEVAASRHHNLRHILERSRIDRAPEIDASTAMERALAAPPPVRLSGHPYVEAEPASDAKQALEAVAKLSKWSAPAKLDMALLALSIPREVVDAAFERVLRDALRFGVALPSTLASRALSFGLAADTEELVSQQIATFRALTEEGEPSLTPTALAQNWEALLESASENEVAIDSETHAVAYRALRAIASDADEDEVVDLEDLPELSEERLLRLFTHPTLRLSAALELLSREDANIKAVSREARKMPREEVLELLPRLVALGESAGDALIDGLSARKTFFRQAAALGLGEIHLRRAVVPLVHLLSEEPSEVWREVARVLSLFGTGAVRAIARAAKDPKLPTERAALAFAHLSIAGCEKQVQKLESDKNRAVAEAAMAARGSKPEAERQVRVVEGAEEPLGDDVTLGFSQRFRAALTSTSDK
ncbi:MAG: hypothetical protein GXP55_25185 [Deltaproteobacteria bacterium]|nr:hypothetical protein [Deltaproteobacteria bacterium]